MHSKTHMRPGSSGVGRGLFYPLHVLISLNNSSYEEKIPRYTPSDPAVLA